MRFYPQFPVSLCLCALLLAPSAFASAGGNVLWVGKAPEGESYRTIQSALNAAHAGDTVRVTAGVYRERVRFRQGGEEGRPIILEGEPGAVIDGSTQVDLQWQAAEDIGPAVYRAALSFFPFTVTANGMTLTTLDEKRTEGEAGSNSPFGWKRILWREAFVNGVGPSGWSGVGALAMYRHKEQELLVRFEGGLDPRDMVMTVAPREPVITISGVDHCIVRGLRIGYSAIGVRIDNSTGSIVENCEIDPADFGVVLERGALNCIVRANRITLNPYAGADPWAAGAWDNWQAVKTGGFYDRIAILIGRTLGGHEITGNFIHDHWDGIDDHGNPPWGEQSADPRDNSGMKVHHNLIYNLNDDALETMGPGIDGQWHDNIIIRTRCGFRIKAPHRGPLYLYRNIFLANKEDFRNWGQGKQFYPDAQVWVYHNTSTSDFAVAMNYGVLDGVLTTPNYHYINNLFWTEGWVLKSARLPAPDWQTQNNVFIRASGEFPRPWQTAANAAESSAALLETWRNGIELALQSQRELDSSWVGAGPAGFVDPVRGNMALRADSPAIGRGIDITTVRNVPLPGFDSGYYSGATPAAGALQAGQPMTQIPRVDLAALLQGVAPADCWKQYE